MIAGLRSSAGASFAILRQLGSAQLTVNVSVPLVLEYEAVAKRQARELGLTFADVEAVIDYICRVASHRTIYYLWRPVLSDPQDDLVLELAVESGAEYIVTHNIRHFAEASRFGVRAVTPGEYLRRVRVIP